MLLAQADASRLAACRGRVITAIALLVLGSSLLPGASGPADLKGRLEADYVPPDWLVTTEVPFTEAELTATNRFGLTIWSQLAAFDADPAKFRPAIATLHRVLKLNSRPAFQASCAQALAYDYEGMIEDYTRAFQWYRQLSALSAQVRQVHDPQNHNLRDTQRLSVLGMARCYAKLGAVPEAEALLKQHTFQDWRELFDLAVAYQSMKDLKRSDAAVAAAVAAGAKQTIWDRVSAAGRGLILFYGNGNLEQVKRQLPSYHRAYQDLVSQEGGKKLADHIVGLNVMVTAITGELDKADPVSFKQLRDGVFEGESPAFNSPIRVSVTVWNGDLCEIKVTRQAEKRCFNALQSIPAQILKQHSLEVDGVTGATVTSLAIKNVVREAVRKAQQ
jgi:uncharacterized protein with FMN-binding domain